MCFRNNVRGRFWLGSLLCLAAVIGAGEALASPQGAPRPDPGPATDETSDRHATVVEGPSQAGRQYCKEHPSAAGGVVRRAAEAGVGISEQRAADEAAGRVPALPDRSGGGPCDDKDAAAWAVGALLYHDKPHCSGVLVGPSTVVTAAHCVKGFDGHKMAFAVGPDSRRPIQRAEVHALIWAPEYDDRTLGVHDIGVVQLSQRITAAKRVHFLDKPLSTTNIQLTHVGYGRTGLRRCVGIPLHDLCDDSFGYESTQMNTCRGDSGGPVFWDAGHMGIFLVGVTNWGDESCALYGVSADVGFHYTWLTEQISLAPPNRPTAPVDSAAPGAAPEHVAGRVQIALVLAVALKRIRDRGGQLEPVWAPTVFLGLQPFDTRRVTIGVLAGMGLAAHTDSGFVGGLGVRVDAWRRLGVVAGYGFRLAPDDRIRSSLGVGLTFRLWSLEPSWR